MDKFKGKQTRKKSKPTENRRLKEKTTKLRMCKKTGTDSGDAPKVALRQNQGTLDQ